jgi:hypothetical protein
MAGQERSLAIQVNVPNQAVQLPRFCSHQQNNLASLSPPWDMDRSPVFRCLPADPGRHLERVFSMTISPKGTLDLVEAVLSCLIFPVWIRTNHPFPCEVSRSSQLRCLSNDLLMETTIQIPLSNASVPFPDGIINKTPLTLLPSRVVLNSFLSVERAHLIISKKCESLYVS